VKLEETGSKNLSTENPTKNEAGAATLESSMEVPQKVENRAT